MKSLLGNKIDENLNFAPQEDCSFVYIRAYKGKGEDSNLQENIKKFKDSKYFYGFYSELNSSIEVLFQANFLWSMYKNLKIDLLPACISLVNLKEINFSSLTSIWKFLYEWNRVSLGKQLVFRVTYVQMKNLNDLILKEGEEEVSKLIQFIKDSSIWIVQEGDLQVEELGIFPAIHEFEKLYGHLRFYGNQKQLETWMKEGELPAILSSGLSDAEKIQFVNILIKILKEGSAK